MNRSNVYFTAKQVRALRRLSRESGMPQAEIIRRAVDAYLAVRGGENAEGKKRGRPRSQTELGG